MAGEDTHMQPRQKLAVSLALLFILNIYLILFVLWASGVK